MRYGFLLYVISAYSGQVILYSTVQGKVTSSGKRLAPSEIASDENSGFRVPFDGYTRTTYQVLGDDGTYGSSVEYLYWWDVQGRYHQHYVSGGQILHVSSEPIAVKSVILNLEVSGSSPASTPDEGAP